jgi:hypothetical protein
MARYEHLPIYKKAMNLTVYFEKIVRNFSRYNKYTLQESDLWKLNRQMRARFHVIPSSTRPHRDLGYVMATMVF